MQKYKVEGFKPSGGDREGFCKAKDRRPRLWAQPIQFVEKARRFTRRRSKHLELLMKSFSREAVEAEIALRFLARANPPPILFRYRRPTDWTLAEISKQQIYATKPDELNDPFEYAAPVFWNIDLMRRQFIEEYAPMQGLSPAEAAKEFDSSYEHGWHICLMELRR